MRVWPVLGVTAAVLLSSFVDASAAPSITTVVGTGYSSSDGVPATRAPIDHPYDVVADQAGNVYISEGRMIRKVDRAGVIRTVADYGDWVYPTSIDVDRAGNVYLANPISHLVQKVDPQGNVSVVAGMHIGGGYNGDGIPAQQALLNAPSGVAVDSAGNIYIAESHGSRIRKVNTSGIISTIAGTGENGANDATVATQAKLNYPVGVAVAGSGDVYIADTENHRIRKVDTGGKITTTAGTGVKGFGGDGHPATGALLNAPGDLGFDSAGNLYLSDYANHRVRKVATNGIITTVAGTGQNSDNGDNRPATTANLYWPHGVGFDSTGSLLIAEYGANRVRLVGSDGVIRAFAGSGCAGEDGPGKATDTFLFMPWDTASNERGTYVTDRGHDRVLFYDPDNGYFSRYASIPSPAEIVADANRNKYVASRAQVYKIDFNGNVTVYAGNGTQGYSGDGGPATNAMLGSIAGLAVDTAGNLYIADGTSPRVRKVTTDGIIRTVVGTGTDAYSGDGGPATTAQINVHGDIGVDNAGNLYLADFNNYRIRKVNSAGVITTIAGNGISANGAMDGEGMPAANVRLKMIYSMVVAADGTVYFTNYGSVVRKISTSGVLTTVVGNGNAKGYAGDGGDPRNALIQQPEGLSLDRAGNLLIADTYNHRVRKVTP